MILKLKDFQDACKTILAAADNNELSPLTESVELVADGDVLSLNVTNLEYYASVKFPLGQTEQFRATVKGDIFLKLIDKLTTQNVELVIDGTNLVVKSNGTYKIPMTYDRDGVTMLALTPITITNVTNSFEIPLATLDNINKYNSGEFGKGQIARQIQKYYYVDEEGCITFVSGACVTKFTLPQPVKLLLSQRLVKQFKLFKDVNVKFTLGCDANAAGLMQTKVKFEAGNIELTAILSDMDLVSTMPATMIRGTAYKDYPYSVNIDKNALAGTIERLLLFSDKTTLKFFSAFEFGAESVKIWDTNRENFEEVKYTAVANIPTPYTAILDFKDIKASLALWTESYVNILCGDQTGVVLAQPAVSIVIPECEEI